MSRFSHFQSKSQTFAAFLCNFSSFGFGLLVRQKKKMSPCPWEIRMRYFFFYILKSVKHGNNSLLQTYMIYIKPINYDNEIKVVKL